MNQSLPEDIRPQWLNLVRRLQSVARRDNQGNAILSVTVLVDADGLPVSWTEPERTLLEPKRQAQHMLEVLGKRRQQT